MPIAPIALLILAIVGVVPFILINAPVEEIVFRGYGLAGISGRWGPAAGVAITSLLFGIQHVVFAPTLPGMIVYFVAYVVWGALAAIIVRKQGRLLPVVVAHWIVNLLASSPGIVLPILMLTGVVEQS